MAIRAFLLGSAAALVAVAAPASAVNLVTNGSFEITTATDKTYFNGQVAGWSGGYNLTFIDFPGTADDPSKYLTVYGPFPYTSPDGGNFVEGDGDPGYSGAIYQTINNLTIGQQYKVTFYQAAGQQLGFTGPTTEQWQVSFGSETYLSSLYSLPQAGVGPWQAQAMTFTATATSQVLQFLAQGTPGGAPPISFLDGVSLSVVPEPASWGMMIVGFGAMGGAMRRRRAVVAA